MGKESKKVLLLHEVVEECDTNIEIIFAGMTLISAVIKTIKEEGDAGYEAAEHAKMMVINEVKEL